jgi:hypothetical protein
MYIHSQSAALYPPSFLSDRRSFPSNGLQQGDMTKPRVCSQIPEAPYIFIAYNGDEIETADSVKVPFHIWQDDEI